MYVDKRTFQSIKSYFVPLFRDFLPSFFLGIFSVTFFLFTVTSTLLPHQGGREFCLPCNSLGMFFPFSCLTDILYVNPVVCLHGSHFDDVLVSDFTGNKAPKFVGHLKSH